jgi:succinate dehydrogenase/fumarate reductase flavoprotein subunit
MYFGMSAVDILKENGRVTGIIAVDKAGDYHKFAATTSVILAAGGFGGNKEMLEDLLPDVAGLFSGDETFPKGMGRSGMGLKLGVWAGGRLEAGPIATMGGNFNTPRGFNCVHGILWLDPKGKRFCNECFGDPVITGFQGNQMKHGTYYNIFDSNIMEDLQWAVPAHEGFDYADEHYVRNVTVAMEKALAAGKGGAISRAPNGPVRIVAGRTMDELLDNAELTGQLRENVKNSILRYNAICQAGRDDDFGKDAKLLRPLDQWPLFIQFNDFNYLGRIMCTCGGLLTDERQNVLDDEFEPIPGLYATGNCCGRRFGPQYSTPTAGVSIGMCVTLGREAGKEAAEKG